MTRPPKSSWVNRVRRVPLVSRPYLSSRTRDNAVATALIPLVAATTVGLLYLNLHNDRGVVFRKAYAESDKDDYKQRYQSLKDRFKRETTEVFSTRDGATMLDLALLHQANQALERVSTSRTIEGIQVDSCILPSNGILGEDRIAASVFSHGSPCGTQEKFLAFSIFDGHAGHATADFLQESLHELVAVQVVTHANMISNEAIPMLNPDMIKQAVVTAFLEADAKVMGIAEAALSDPHLPAASARGVGSLAPALSGSCALLALFQPSTSVLRVACVGDSRAVLGRADLSGNHCSIPMSVDQTGFNPSEVARITSEHPSDEKIIDPKTGRVHGIAVSRAFGDARWKWTDEMMKDAAYRFWAHGPRPGGVIKTPPYLTALPEIKEIKIEGDGALPDFLIMASDGFWDIFSNEDAVTCVQQWIRAKKTGFLDRVEKSIANEQLRAEIKKRPLSDQDLFEDDGQLRWRVKPEHFTVEDDNCATHLLRNALGGKRRSLFCAVMGVAPPLSRDVRDDISIHVIFFGKV